MADESRQPYDRAEAHFHAFDARANQLMDLIERLEARVEKSDRDRDDIRKEIEGDVRVLLDLIGTFKLDMAQAEGKLRTEIATANGAIATKIATDNGELRLQIQKDNGEFMTKLKSVGKTAAIVYAILLLILSAALTGIVNYLIHK